MSKQVKQDKAGNFIGDGRFHVNYDVYEFREYPQITSNISKSESSESVYVKYTNTKNLNSITVRFSNHQNNAVKFGDQLNGFTTSKNEILAHLGLIKRIFIPNTHLSILSQRIKIKDIPKYEQADLTIQEMYALGEGADISMFNGKLAKGSTYLIVGDVIKKYNETKQDMFGNSIEVGKYKFVPLDTITLEEINLEEINIETKRKYFLDLFKEKLLSSGFTFNENMRTYKDLDNFSNKNRKFLLQEKLDNDAFSYIWIEKNEFGSKFPRGKYIDYLMENKEQLFSFLNMQINPANQQILTNFKNTLHEILGSCKNTGYPNICQLRDTAGGEEQIFKGVLDICNKTGMNIASAVAQYESSLS